MMLRKRPTGLVPVAPRTSPVRTLICALIAVLLPIVASGPAAHALPARCGADAIAAGKVCLDRYEASVWRVPQATTTNLLLVRRIQLGRATEADLLAGGATELGTTVDDYGDCRDTGQNCADIYAVSLPAEIPSTHISWFQAQEACANAGKELPTSAEWQIGATGTPDSIADTAAPECNSDSGSVARTGSQTRCVSTRGAFDMVGNVAEWVADWMPRSTACPGWGGISDDQMCLSGTSDSLTGPGARSAAAPSRSWAVGRPAPCRSSPPFNQLASAISSASVALADRRGNLITREES